MKRIYIVFFAMLLLMVAACNKSSVFKGTDLVRLGEAQVLTFKVSLPDISATT